MLNQSITRPERLVYDRVQLRRLGFNQSNSTLIRLEAVGEFPKRVRIGAHSIAWIASEIEAYVTVLAAKRGVTK